MLINTVLNQVANSEITPPWELPPIWWVLGFGLDISLVALVWLWARSGRTKREKDTPFDRSAENFANTIQAGYGAVPTFLFVIWLAVILFIITYSVLSIANGPQY